MALPFNRAKEANMRKEESAVLHLALSVILVAALIAISIPAVAAEIVFAPKMLKDGASDSPAARPPYSF